MESDKRCIFATGAENQKDLYEKNNSSLPVFHTNPCKFSNLKNSENFEIYKALCGKPCKRDWVAKVVFLIQMLLTFDGRCNSYFLDIRRLKIHWFPNFNMLFQLVLTKLFRSELFSCLVKVDHVINSCKGPILDKIMYLPFL